MQFACINSSSLPKDVFLFAVQACGEQLEEVAAAWGLKPPAAAAYETVAQLPADDIYIVEIVDDIDQPGALGFHSVDLVGRPYVRVLAQGAATSITLSHEFIETLIDLFCDQWMPRPDGTQVAKEVADPVEGDAYTHQTEVLDETRPVQVSNYVLPAWFDADSAGPWDHMGTVKAPFGMSPGGYMVVLDSDGNENEVFARLRYASLAGIATAGKRLAVRNSRLLRRLDGRRRGGK